MQPSTINHQPATVFTFTEGERRIFRIPERISTADWAERYRIVVDGGRKSPWRNDLSPCAVGVMDALDAPFIREVYVQASPQTIKTQPYINYLMKRVDISPSSAVLTMPVEKLTLRIFKRRLSKSIKDTPRTAAMLSPILGDVTRTSIAFVNGMDIIGAWAGSISSLSSDAFEIAIGDEVNKPEYLETQGDEPNAVDALRERTNSFPFTYKLYLCSSASGEYGLITTTIRDHADVIYHYHAKCPVCGEVQRMVWENITWGDIVDPRKVIREKRARYNCKGCGMQWDDDMRNRAVLSMMNNGWIADNRKCASEECGWTGHDTDADFIKNKNKCPRCSDEVVELEEIARPRAVAFILPSWYVKTMSSAVANFLYGQKDPTKLKVWVTQDCSEAWKERAARPKKIDEILKSKCALKPQTVPEAAIALTCGIDVQKAGFWFATRAWARDVHGLTGWLIHYGFLMTWGQVESLLFETEYPIENGGSMRIWRAALDTGGGKKDDNMSMTEETYWWIIANYYRGVQLYGTKGSSRPMSALFKKGEPLMKTATGKKLPDWFHIVQVNTDMVKDMFHYGLERAANSESNALYLHSETDEVYARHILAEEKRPEGKSKVARYVRISPSNHLLDADLLSWSLAQPQWIGGGVNILAPPVRDSHPGAKKVINKKQQNKISRW
jgi:phage terminase large subunit GpA-like protein